MKYVYIKSEPNLWTVGFYDPSGKWNPESDHDSKEEASNRVAFLNAESIPEVKVFIRKGRLSTVDKPIGVKLTIIDYDTVDGEKEYEDIVYPADERWVEGK